MANRSSQATTVRRRSLQARIKPEIPAGNAPACPSAMKLIAIVRCPSDQRHKPPHTGARGGLGATPTDGKLVCPLSPPNFRGPPAQENWIFRRQDYRCMHVAADFVELSIPPVSADGTRFRTTLRHTLQDIDAHCRAQAQAA